jgi:hypothetical protein
MKICTKCKIPKDEKEFNKHSNNKDKKSSWCKICTKIISTKYYEDNKSLVLKKQHIRDNEKKQYINNLKENIKCQKCGYNKCIVALDYHHLDPSKKDFNIATTRVRNINTEYSRNLIEKEIEKCIVLCANCHREFHYLEKIEKNNNTRIFIISSKRINGGALAFQA